MKFVDFLNESANKQQTKDGLKFELGEHSAKVEFFEQIQSYRLFSSIYNDDKLKLSADGVRYGFKVDSETAGILLSSSSPRKDISSEIARRICIDTMLESTLDKFGIALGTRSIKKKGSEIHIEAYKKYDRSTNYGTLIFRNKGLIDVDIKVGKEWRHVEIGKDLTIDNYKQLASDIKDAIGL